MDFYPAFLDLANRKCLVIGNSHQALRRARRLRDCGANVTLISDDSNSTPAAVQNIDYQTRRWSTADLCDCWLVIAATGEVDRNDEIANACQQQRLFCNVISDTRRSSFLVPAIIDRSPLLLALASGGRSPVLARVLKSKLETLIPHAYSRLAMAMSDSRDAVMTRLPDARQRSRFWQQLVEGPAGELAFQHSPETMQRTIEQAVATLEASEQTDTSPGHVALVGAGPGDPDLLTFRALRLIQSADVLVYDRLVSPAILQLSRSDAELIYAGKARADHALPQDSINQLLVDLARDGKQVVRLKGGDPFIFGRGGEEIETLAESGIPFQVVPGITAAAGCAAFSGIPLTHRDHAQSCVFVTGHLRNGEINMNWQDLQDPTQTIVVYMGLIGLAQICASLIEHGRATDTPAALVEQGTTPSQRVLVGTLTTLPDTVANNDVSAPTLLLIGSVVTLREQLKWFEPGFSL